MNRMAQVVRCEMGDVSIETVLNLSAFDMDQALERRPTFLEPEYPFEWTGVYSLEAGRYELSLAEGPDPAMSLVVVPVETTTWQKRTSLFPCSRFMTTIGGGSYSPSTLVAIGMCFNVGRYRLFKLRICLCRKYVVVYVGEGGIVLAEDSAHGLLGEAIEDSSRFRKINGRRLSGRAL